MSLNLYDIDINEILSLFRTAYFNQYGETLRIGSVEFNAASVFTYALSVLINNLNTSAKQRWIDTATGEYLDAIAATYGLSRPSGYNATTTVQLTPTSSPIIIPEESITLSDSSGRYLFKNPFKIELSGQGTAIFKAVNAGSEYNGIPVGGLNNIIDGTAFISAASNTVPTSGGSDSMENDDDAFRAWLKVEIQSFSGAGTYLAYEARAKNADIRVQDVKVIQQGDGLYQKGKVQIVVLPDASTPDPQTVIQLVQDACNDRSFRPVGDFVTTRAAYIYNRRMEAVCHVTYPERFDPLADAHNAKVLEEYNKYLREKIARPIVYEEIAKRLCTPDENGVYALDVRFAGAGTIGYILPQSDTVVQISYMRFENHLAVEG